MEQCAEHADGQYSRAVAHAHCTQDEGVDHQEGIPRRGIESRLVGSHLWRSQDMGHVELLRCRRQILRGQVLLLELHGDQRGDYCGVGPFVATTCLQDPALFIVQR